jgi:ribonuclease HII
MIIIGVDEAGRGPLFGDVYTSCVILPIGNFDESCLKDSKRFSSKKKIKEVYEYIKDNVEYYDIDFATIEEIDKHNILQATQRSMHRSIQKLITKYLEKNPTTNLSDFKICVDGNYFNSFHYFYNDQIHIIQHECLVKGDDKCKSISAASILAKVSRDEYILQFINQFPDYESKYNLSKNKGYGTKQHIEGIKQYGYSPYHRKSFKLKSI